MRGRGGLSYHIVNYMGEKELEKTNNKNKIILLCLFESAATEIIVYSNIAWETICVQCMIKKKHLIILLQIQLLHNLRQICLNMAAFLYITNLNFCYSLRSYRTSPVFILSHFTGLRIISSLDQDYLPSLVRQLSPFICSGLVRGLCKKINVDKAVDFFNLLS